MAAPERPSEWHVTGSYFEACNCEAICPCGSIFLGRAGGSVANLYGPAIGGVHAIRSARITLEHVNARKRIDVVGYLTIEAEGAASEAGDVRCGIPGFDHRGTELFADVLRSTDEALRWEVRGRRKAAFATDFEYSSDR